MQLYLVTYGRHDPGLGNDAIQVAGRKSETPVVRSRPWATSSVMTFQVET